MGYAKRDRDPFCAYSRRLSPGIAVVLIAAFASTLAEWAAPSRSNMFATATNIAYTLTGVYLEILDQTTRNRPWAFRGLVNGLPTALAILGAASFAFHAMNDPQEEMYHSFDRFGGYFVTLQTVHASTYVTILALIGLCRCAPDAFETAKVWIGVGMAMGTMVAFSLIFAFWNGLENDGDFVFAALLIVLIITVLISRFAVVRRATDPKASFCGFITTDVIMALLECFVVLVVAWTALLMQGSFVGAPFNSIDYPEQYDTYHGYWHVLLSIAILMIYVRTEESAGVVQGLVTIETRQPDGMEIFGAVSVVLLCGLLITFKESGMDMNTVRIVLTVFTGIMQPYAVRALYQTIQEFLGRTRRWDAQLDDLKYGKIHLAATPATTFRYGWSDIESI